MGRGIGRERERRDEKDIENTLYMIQEELQRKRGRRERRCINCTEKDEEREREIEKG